ncbi:hypothetical protein C8P63_1462 [Melghirimyces profundicolus]|uniref:Uncharacterized protein n=1 Tax=Melghirimyces profundicolus TaxID=1242148 RepID=A0A2T6AWU7_9BACL|nr:hypothetical protein [Melghirimyces profundicolus]PTX48294.1 hypothetical protein C8P63_1462 [Melghirimyces profundicolus]
MVEYARELERRRFAKAPGNVLVVPRPEIYDEEPEEWADDNE